MKSALVIATLAATSYAAKVRQEDPTADASLDATMPAIDANAGVDTAPDANLDATMPAIDDNAGIDAAEVDTAADAAPVEDDITAGSTIEAGDQPMIKRVEEPVAQIDYVPETKPVKPKTEDPILDPETAPMIEDPVLPPTFADIEQAKVAQPDVMVWSEEEIQAWTSTELTGMEWDSIKKNHLLSDDARDAYTTGVVTKLVQQWSQSISGWPAVCEAGLKCRKDRFGVLMTELQQDWGSALESIDRIIGNKIAKTKTILEASWEAAYNCDDGCECEDIDVVYGHIITTQERITKEIITLKGELKTFIEEETEILEYCPEYADVDGSYVYKVYDKDQLHYTEDGETVVGADIRAEAFATTATE